MAWMEASDLTPIEASNASGFKKMADFAIAFVPLPTKLVIGERNRKKNGFGVAKLVPKGT
jgi:hypothetical protein